MTIVSGLALHKCARGDTVNAASLWLPSKLSTVCWNSIGFMFFKRLFKYIRWTVCPHCNSLGLFWEKIWELAIWCEWDPFWGVTSTVLQLYIVWLHFLTTKDTTTLLPYMKLLQPFDVISLCLLSRASFRDFFWAKRRLFRLSVLTYKSFYLISFLSF